VLGLTFKPNTDDMREAPSIPLITALLDIGARVKAYDPEGMQRAKDELPVIKYCEDPYGLASGADGLVIVTEWRRFRGPRPEAAEERYGTAGDRRPAQHLPAGRHGRARL
jgi:UDP-glucose 6-dehydrogenase